MQLEASQERFTLMHPPPCFLSVNFSTSGKSRLFSVLSCSYSSYSSGLDYRLISVALEAIGKELGRKGKELGRKGKELGRNCYL